VTKIKKIGFNPTHTIRSPRSMLPRSSEKAHTGLLRPVLMIFFMSTMSTMSTNLSCAISGQAIIMIILTIMLNYHILERFLVSQNIEIRVNVS
jgi:hypothetical protein